MSRRNIIALSLGLIAFLAVLWLGAIVAFAARGALQVREAMTSAQAAMAQSDVAGVTRSLDVAQTGLSSVRRAVDLAAPVDVIPPLGKNRRAARDTFASLDPAIDAVRSTLTVVSDAQAALARVSGTGSALEDTRAWKNLTPEEKQAVLQSLKESNVTLRAGLVSLTRSQEQLAVAEEKYRGTALHNIIAPLSSAVTDVRSAAELLVPMSEIAPELLGLNGDRQYLVLYLNNSEIRPGGGFIGYYALALMRNGELVDFTSEDSYEPTWRIKDPSYNVPIPQPMTLGLGVKSWYFRDAAWSPDFAETAKTARTLLRQESAAGGMPVPEVHGVIGITPDVVAGLMRLTGPITLRGETVTPDELYDVLQYSTQKGFVDAGVEYNDRKYLVTEVTKVIIDKLQNLSPASWLDAFHIIEENRDRKLFALWSQDQATQAVLEERGWAGRITPRVNEDVFALVDANLGALKTDPVITRDIAYSVRLENGTPIARATVTYKHAGGFDYKTTRYITYARVYAPAGSTLRRIDGAATPAQASTDLGLTTFGALVVTEPGTSKTVTYEYTLPSSIVPTDGRPYTLRAYKQMGVIGDNALTVDVDFDTKLSAAVPAESQEHFGDDHYTVTLPLDSDKTFTVRYTGK